LPELNIFSINFVISSKETTRDKCVISHHGVARSEIADGEDGINI
jgi:hypothetical protein